MLQHTKDIPLERQVDVESVYLGAKWERCHMDLRGWTLPPTALGVPHIQAKEVDVHAFECTYTAGAQPVMIHGLADAWPAKAWTLEHLLSHYADQEFRVTTEHARDFYSLSLPLKDYQRYLHSQQDESPLYVFDRAFGETFPELLDGYSVPEYFKTDYLSVLGQEQPPYRWIVLGPMRSGAAWHVDPFGSSAWNTLLVGRKLWALYPPDVVPPAVIVDATGVHAPTSLQWMLEVFPMLPSELQPTMAMQCPGETIFVPSGWWHMVLNVEDTLAITQNFVDDSNLHSACEELRTQPIFASFVTAVKQKLPQLEPFVSRFQALTGTDRVMQYLQNEGFSTRQAFLDSFGDMDIWRPRVQQALTQAQLPYTHEIIANTSSHNPIFFCGEVAIKFFSPEAEMDYQAVEVNALRQLDGTAGIPHLYASGTLYESNSVWTWPWIVMERYRDVLPVSKLLNHGTNRYHPKTTEELDVTTIVPWLATMLRDLHHRHVDTTDTFSAHVQQAIGTAVKKHQRWRLLPPHLLAQLQDYFTAAPQVVLNTTGLLHGDLNPDNILVSTTHQPVALIDYADGFAGPGDYMWDLVMLYVTTFSCDQLAWTSFLQHYHSPTITADQLERDQERGTLYALLWPFEGLLRHFIQTVGNDRLWHCTSIHDLHQLLWSHSSSS
jgi:aminoglycoside phosphotransferase (APT) family kinase protein